MLPSDFASHVVVVVPNGSGGSRFARPDERSTSGRIADVFPVGLQICVRLHPHRCARPQPHAWCGGAQAMPKKSVNLRGWRPRPSDFVIGQKKVFVCASVLDHADSGILKLWNQTPADDDGIDWGRQQHCGAKGQGR